MPPQLGLEAVLPFTCTSKTFQPCSTRVVPIDLEAPSSHGNASISCSRLAHHALTVSLIPNLSSFRVFQAPFVKSGNSMGLFPLFMDSAESGKTTLQVAAS